MWVSLCDAFLIRGNDLPQILRVHPGGKSRRTDEVGKHHSDLAALGGVLRLRFGRSSRLRWRWRGTAKLLYGREYF
jgi:hypothetical protein